jgi:hypothetical protein
VTAVLDVMIRKRPGLVPMTAIGVVSVVLMTVAGGASAATRYERDGIDFRVPSGWSLTPRRINGVIDPVTVFTVSTFRFRAGGGSKSSGVCSIRLRRAWRADAAYLQLTEERDGASLARMLRRAPPRPRHFLLGGKGWGGLCTPPNSGELTFRAHGRAFYVFYGFGRNAPQRLRAQAEASLDGMRISRRR